MEDKNYKMAKNFLQIVENGKFFMKMCSKLSFWHLGLMLLATI